LILYRILRATLGAPIRLLWRVQVTGLERLPPGGCVLAPNHDSLSDPFFLGAALPRPLCFLAKSELDRFPLRSVLRGVGAIPVRRGGGDLGAIERAVEAVSVGATVVIYPQGTVLGAPDRPWKRGAARVAIATGTPLVPIALLATDRALRRGGVRIRFPRVGVVVLAALDPGPARVPTEDEASELTERVRRAVEAATAPARACTGGSAATGRTTRRP
jgi:1-acyl-sn-glycerol-3-phosphate acyltransferase